MKDCPTDKGVHCCDDMNLAINWNSMIGFDPGDEAYAGGYVLPLDGNSSDGVSINFCPFCGTVLPGAPITDWEKHEKGEAWHWTGLSNSAMMPKCTCSNGYEELKRIQDETN